MNATIRTSRSVPRTTRLLILTALAAALAACSTVPDRNAALDAAHSRFSVAQSDPQVGALAPEELKRATESLRTADAAQAAGSDRATVDHLAYMSSQRLTIAQDTAASKAAQALTAGAAAERDRLRLAARTNEAASAQQDASASQRQLARSDARVADLQTQLNALNAKKTERGMVVTLGDVLFDSGKSQLLATSSQDMAQLAEFFKRNPERKASIEGHTDSVGSEESNRLLSERRAGAVKAALVRMDVPANRLSSRGFGEDSPVASNDTPAGRQMNRRVEIVISPDAADVSMR
jgi:outer membrane protein OmpA-like peptidoglycan-associated protein